MSEHNENERNENEQNELNDKDQSVEVEQEHEETNDTVQDSVVPTTTVSEDSNAAAAGKSSANIVPWVITVIAIAALVFVLIRNTSGGDQNKVVGEMDGISIKESDLYEEVSSQMSDEQLVALVEDVAQKKIIASESEKAGLTITEEDIKQEMESIKKEYNIPSDEELSAALAQSGATIEDFKEKQVIPQLKIKKLFENKHPASEADLKAYYESNKDSFATTPKEVKASHILLATKEEAEAVLAELKAGKDFATLAKEKSQDPGSKDNGGDLGFFGRGVMNPEFENAAFALAKGEMSEVVDAPQSGFHIIKLTDVKEGVYSTYEEAKADVKNAYYNEKMMTEAQTWLDNLKKDRNFKNLLATTPEPAATGSTEAPSTAAPEASAPAAQ